MSDTTGQISMFVFALALLLERLMAVALALEVYFFGVGMKVLKTASLRDIQMTIFPIFFYLAALVVAAVDFFGTSEEYDGSSDSSTYGKARSMASAEEGSSYASESKYAKSTSNVPMILILAGFISWQVFAIIKVVCLFPGGGKHKE